MVPHLARIWNFGGTASRLFGLGSHDKTEEITLDRNDPYASQSQSYSTIPSDRKRNGSLTRLPEAKRQKQDPAGNRVYTPRPITSQSQVRSAGGKAARMPKPFSNGFQPRNSLNKTPPSGLAVYGNRAGGARGEFGTLLTETHRGDNVSRRASISTPWDEGEMRSVKRRKTLSSPPRSSVTVASDDYEDGRTVDDEFFEREMESVVMQKKRHGGVKTNSEGSECVDLSRSSFSRSYSDDVDNRLNPKKEKARKPKDPVAATNVLDVDDDVVIEVQRPSNNGSSRKPRNISGTKDEPVAVDEDAPEAGKNRGRSDSEISSFFPPPVPGNIFQKHSIGNLKKKQVAEPQEALHDATKIASAEASTHAQRRKDKFDMLVDMKPVDGGSRPSLPPRTSRNANSVGKLRAHSPEVIVQQHAVKKQLVDSSARKKAPSPSHLSEDELSGPTTRLGRGDTNKLGLKATRSPHDKDRLPPSAQAPQKSPRGRPRDASPSDLRGTQFSTSAMEHNHEVDNDVNTPLSMYDMIPLDGVYTKLGHAKDTQIFIKFHPDGRHFLIAIEGHYIKRPREQGGAVYEAKHITSWTWSNDSFHVIIQGPKSDVSDGLILLQFSDFKGRANFFRLFRAMAERSSEHEDDVSFDLEKRFFHLWTERTQPRPRQAMPLVDDSDGVTAIQQRHAKAFRQSTDVPSQKKRALSLDVEEQQPTSRQFQLPRQPDIDDQPIITTKRARKSSGPLVNGHDSQNLRSSQRLQNKPTSTYRVPDHDSPPPAIERWSQAHRIPKWDSPLTYPFSGARRTTVEVDDIERLDDGEFLNDNLISFGLRRLEDQFPESTRNVHIFNTHFYTALTTKNNRKSFNYDNVKRWTKSIDLFSFPFVVVPINVDLHWFLAIICNLPKLSQAIELDDDTQEQATESNHGLEDNSQVTTPVRHASTPSQDFQNMTLDSVPETNLGTTAALPILDTSGELEIPDSDEEHRKARADAAERRAQGQNMESTINGTLPSSGRKTKKKPQPAVRKQNPNDPLIITVDSFGSAHSTEVRHLKEYIKAEALDKRNLQVERNEIYGITAKGVPEQTNFCDCGVYLIGYVIEFLRNPRVFVDKACSKEFDRNNDFAGFEPSEKRAEIRNDLIELADKQKELKKAAKRQRLLEKKKAAATIHSDQAVSEPSYSTAKQEAGSISGHATSSPALPTPVVPINAERSSAAKPQQSPTKESTIAPAPALPAIDKVSSPQKSPKFITKEPIVIESQTQRTDPPVDESEDELLLDHEGPRAKGPSAPSLSFTNFMDQVQSVAGTVANAVTGNAHGEQAEESDDIS